MLREGIEAAPDHRYCCQFFFFEMVGTQRADAEVFWLGVFLASVMCLGIGYGIHSATGEIPQMNRDWWSASSAWWPWRC